MDEASRKFDGIEVDGLRVALSGSVDTEHTFALEEEVTLVVKGRVKDVSHKTNQFGVVRRVHSVKADHVVVAPDAVARDVDAEIKRLADEAAGQASLDAEIDGAGDE